MAIIKAFITLSALSANSNLRLCYSGENSKTNHNLIKLFDCLDSFEAGCRPSGGIIHLDNDEECALSLGGEQINADGSVDLKKMPLVPIDFYNKTSRGKVQQDDILVCKDGALTGKSCYVSDDFPIKEVMVNEHVYIFRGNGKINQKILFHLIQSQYVQFQIKDLAYRKKGQPGLNAEHLSKIKIPHFDDDLQKKLFKTVLDIEQKIIELKKSKLQIEEVINKVFTEEFNIDFVEFEKIQFEKKYKINFSDLGKTTDFRTTTKFHSIKYDFLNLAIFKKHKFGDFSEFMTLGRQIQPEQYEEESDFYYLMPNSVKSFSLNDELMQPIKEDFFKKFNHISLKLNDLILVASGEGSIGKSAVFDSEKQTITSQFVMKIELKNTELVNYFYYYMQSSFFLLTVEKFKKGMGNMTNIFVSQVKDFPILYDENKIKYIVEKIKSQIDAQSYIDKEIEKNMAKINLIIDDAIKNQ